MFTESLLRPSPALEAAHFLVASLPAVRTLSLEAASVVETAILWCDDRLIIPKTVRPGKDIDRDAVLHTLNYAIPELENGAPEAAAAVRLAITILMHEVPAPIR